MESFKILTKHTQATQVYELDRDYDDYDNQVMYGGHVTGFFLDNINKKFNIILDSVDEAKVPITGAELHIDNEVFHMKYSINTNVFSIIETNEISIIYAILESSYQNKVVEIFFKERTILDISDLLSHGSKHAIDALYGNNSMIPGYSYTSNDATFIYHNYIENLLPKLMAIDGNSENFKKLLSIYARRVSDMNADMNVFAGLYDIENISGFLVDIYGSLYNMYREKDETDFDFKYRIYINSLKRVIPNSIIATQEAIDALVPPRFDINGDIAYGFTIVENPYTSNTGDIEHASSALIGFKTSKTDSDKIFTLLKNILPTGVRVTNQIVASYDTWEAFMDDFNSWNDVLPTEYTW